MAIEELIVELSKDPFNSRKNFDAAVEYEKINQTASAVSFYLRAVEYGTEDDKEVMYTSLLKMAHCFNDQKGREQSVTNALLQAITVLPERPEAYFKMSQYFERAGQWQETYSWAVMGLHAEEHRLVEMKGLPADVEYKGKYCLLFEKAVSAWWIGRPEESKYLFNHLLKKYKMTDDYIQSCERNLANIDK